MRKRSVDTVPSLKYGHYHSSACSASTSSVFSLRAVIGEEKETINMTEPIGIPIVNTQDMLAQAVVKAVKLESE